MTEKRVRDGRIPFHEQKKIGADITPGFHGRLVTDKDGQIAALEKGGYRKVHRANAIRCGEKDASDASQLGEVACQPVGNGEVGYYMEIPLELYEADQKAKQKENDRVMRDIGALKGIDEKNQRGEFTMEGDGKTVKIKH